MEKRFGGKCAIVTGSAAGIGKGCAVRLATEGADIVVADVDIDAIVTKVQRQLMRRLAIESERRGVNRWP